jgi:hypothetical protein
MRGRYPFNARLSPFNGVAHRRRVRVSDFGAGVAHHLHGAADHFRRQAWEGAEVRERRAQLAQRHMGTQARMQDQANRRQDEEGQRIGRPVAAEIEQHPRARPGGEDIAARAESESGERKEFVVFGGHGSHAQPLDRHDTDPATAADTPPRVSLLHHGIRNRVRVDCVSGRQLRAIRVNRPPNFRLAIWRRDQAAHQGEGDGMGARFGAQAVTGPIDVVVDGMSGQLKRRRNLDRGFTAGNAPQTLLLARTQRNNFLHPRPLSHNSPECNDDLNGKKPVSHPAPGG